MTEIVKVQGTALTIQPDQTEFTDPQAAVLAQLGMKGASRADLALFFHQAVRTGLDPFAKQIYMIERWTKDGKRQTIQTGIDGLRLIARRAADRAGETLSYEDTLWCGEDGQWTDVWLKREAPAAARVVVLRNGQRFPSTAHYSEFVATNKDGKPNPMWASKGALMLAKCAEAGALRKAFPQDLSGINTADEMGQADNPPAAQAPAPVAAALEPPADAITEQDWAELHALAVDAGIERPGSFIQAFLRRHLPTWQAIKADELPAIRQAIADHATPAPTITEEA